MMSPCGNLLRPLKEGIVAELSKEVDNHLWFEHLNLCLGVESLWTFDQSRLSVPDNPTPDHDREGELFLFGVDVVAFLHPPHYWAIRRCGKTGLISEQCVGPVSVLVSNAKNTPPFNLPLCQPRSTSQRFIR